MACLEEVIYDKLYIRPPAKTQYITVFGKKIINTGRHCLGNCANDLIVVSHERRDYTKSIVHQRQSEVFISEQTKTLPLASKN